MENVTIPWSLFQALVQQVSRFETLQRPHHLERQSAALDIETVISALRASQSTPSDAGLQQRAVWEQVGRSCMSFISSASPGHLGRHHHESIQQPQSANPQPTTMDVEAVIAAIRGGQPGVAPSDLQLRVLWEKLGPSWLSSTTPHSPTTPVVTPALKSGMHPPTAANGRQERLAQASPYHRDLPSHTNPSVQQNSQQNVRQPQPEQARYAPHNNLQFQGTEVLNPLGPPSTPPNRPQVDFNSNYTNASPHVSSNLSTASTVVGSANAWTGPTSMFNSALRPQHPSPSPNTGSQSALGTAAQPLPDAGPQPALVPAAQAGHVDAVSASRPPAPESIVSGQHPQAGPSISSSAQAPIDAHMSASWMQLWNNAAVAQDSGLATTQHSVRSTTAS
ncbi:hypothetical protein A4X13_0g4889 [Tilletia indica]|uniref:Uncharacterized protein n=1 Tax=Tilletia indica TaxID=43049 RepID=A0A8T8SXF4_9BASI|nr:hypothetical protein A4X13_0g4889 [Tilletia indica]